MCGGGGSVRKPVATCDFRVGSEPPTDPHETAHVMHNTYLTGQANAIDQSRINQAKPFYERTFLFHY